MRFALILFVAAAATLAAGCRRPPAIRIEESQLEVITEEVGYGEPASHGQVVTIDYRITLPEGDLVQAFNGHRFQLGRGTVIEGLDEAVTGMRTGGRRVVTCPPHMHWGRAGFGDGAIPANTPLALDIRLIRCEAGADD